MKAKINKIISIIVSISFLTNGAVFAQPQISPQPVVSCQPQTSIYIPEQYGKIEPANRQTGKQANSPTVILIKDAHCNFEAQHNISKILEILVRDYDIDLVGVEGAEGDLDLTQYVKYKDEKAKEKAVDVYVKKGYVTGPEYLNITKYNELPFGIYGIEDGRLYVENFIKFRETWANNSEIEYFIKEASKIIEQLKEKIYSKELFEFDEKAVEYDNNKIPLTEWIKYLNNYKLLPKNLKNLNSALKAISLEESIDFKKVEKDREELIKMLEKKLPKEALEELVRKSLEFRLGKIPQVKYYRYLEQYILGQSISKQISVVNLKKYIHLNKLQSKIESDGLFNELELITANIKREMFQNELQRSLDALSIRIKILNKLFHLQLQKKDLEYFKSNRNKFTVESLLPLINIQAPLNNIIVPPPFTDNNFLIKMSNCILPADRFYQIAIQRDKELVENTLYQMEKKNKEKAVMVVGGFHSEGIIKLLEQKNVNYLVISPKITKEQLDSPYLSIMLDKEINYNSQILSQKNLANPELLSSMTGPIRDGSAAFANSVQNRLVALIQQFESGKINEDEFKKRILEITRQDRAVVEEIMAGIDNQTIRDIIGGLFGLNTADVSTDKSSKAGALKIPGMLETQLDYTEFERIKQAASPFTFDTTKISEIFTDVGINSQGVILNTVKVYVSDKLPPAMHACGKKAYIGLVIGLETGLEIIISKEYSDYLNSLPDRDKYEGLAEVIDHEWTEHMTVGCTHRKATAREKKYFSKNGTSLTPYHKWVIGRMTDEQLGAIKEEYDGLTPRECSDRGWNLYERLFYEAVKRAEITPDNVENLVKDMKNDDVRAIQVIRNKAFRLARIARNLDASQKIYLKNILEALYQLAYRDYVLGPKLGQALRIEGIQAFNLIVRDGNTKLWIKGEVVDYILKLRRISGQSDLLSDALNNIMKTAEEAYETPGLSVKEKIIAIKIGTKIIKGDLQNRETEGLKLYASLGEMLEAMKVYDKELIDAIMEAYKSLVFLRLPSDTMINLVVDLLWGIATREDIVNVDVRGTAMDAIMEIYEEALTNHRQIVSRAIHKCFLHDQVSGKTVHQSHINSLRKMLENKDFIGSAAIDAIRSFPEEAHCFSYIILKRFASNQAFLRSVISDDSLDVRVRIYAVGLLALNHNITVDLSPKLKGDIRKLLHRLCMPMGSDYAKKLLKSPFIKFELQVCTLAMLIFGQDNIGSGFFSNRLLFVANIRCAMSAKIVRDYGNANSAFEFGNRLMDQHDGMGLLMTLAHEWFHNVLSDEYKLNAGDGINNASIHEFMSDLCSFAFAAKMGRNNAVSNSLEFLKAEENYSWVKERGYQSVEQHEAARAQIISIEKKLNFSADHYAWANIYECGIIELNALRKSLLEASMLFGEELDFYKFVRKVLIRYAKTYLFREDIDDTAGLNRPTVQSGTIKGKYIPIMPESTVGEILWGETAAEGALKVPGMADAELEPEVFNEIVQNNGTATIENNTYIPAIVKMEKVYVYFSDKLPPTMHAYGKVINGKLYVIVSKEYSDYLNSLPELERDKGLAEVIDHEWTEHITVGGTHRKAAARQKQFFGKNGTELTPYHKWIIERMSRYQLAAIVEEYETYKEQKGWGGYEELFYNYAKQKLDSSVKTGVMEIGLSAVDKNAIASSLGIDADIIGSLLSRLDDKGIDRDISVKLLRLMKADGAIQPEEVQLLIDCIDKALTAINTIGDYLGDGEKKEAVKRLGTYLAILKLQKIVETQDEWRQLPKFMDELKQRIQANVTMEEEDIKKLLLELLHMDYEPSGTSSRLEIYLQNLIDMCGDGEDIIRLCNKLLEYKQIQVKVYSTLKVDSKDITKATPFTNIAMIVNSYLRDRINKNMTANIVVRYLMGERKFSEDISENKMIIEIINKVIKRSKELIEIDNREQTETIPAQSEGLLRPVDARDDNLKELDRAIKEKLADSEECVLYKAGDGRVYLTVLSVENGTLRDGVIQLLDVETSGASVEGEAKIQAVQFLSKLGVSYKIFNKLNLFKTDNRLVMPARISTPSILLTAQNVIKEKENAMGELPKFREDTGVLIDTSNYLTLADDDKENIEGAYIVHNTGEAGIKFIQNIRDNKTEYRFLCLSDRQAKAFRLYLAQHGIEYTKEEFAELVDLMGPSANTYGKMKSKFKAQRVVTLANPNNPENKRFYFDVERRERIIMHEDLVLAARIAILLGNMEDISSETLRQPQSGLKRILEQYYSGTEYSGRIDELIEEMLKSSLWCFILPPMVPFVQEYYNALKGASELIRQAA